MKDKNNKIKNKEVKQMMKLLKTLQTQDTKNSKIIGNKFIKF